MLETRIGGSAFSFWFQIQLAPLQQGLACAVAKMAHRSTSAAFESWVDVVATLRRIQVAMDRVVMRWSQRRMCAALDRWCEVVAAANRHVALAARVRTRLTNQACARAWTQWAVYTASRRSAKIAAIHRIRNRAVAGAFGKWEADTWRAREGRLVMASAARTWNKHLARKAWSKWAVCTVAEIRRVRVLVRALDMVGWCRLAL